MKKWEGDMNQIGTSYQVQNANVKTELELPPCFHDYEKLNHHVMQIMLF